MARGYLPSLVQSNVVFALIVLLNRYTANRRAAAIEASPADQAGAACCKAGSQAAAAGGRAHGVTEAAAAGGHRF